MPEPGQIIYVDHSEIRSGKLEELKAAIKDLAEFVKSKEPRIIAHNAYLSADSKSLSVVHIHVDSASLEFHGNVAGPAFARFADLIRLLTIDVYGEPSGAVMDQLRMKAKMVGNATLAVHKLEAGFSRFEVC